MGYLESQKNMTYLWLITSIIGIIIFGWGLLSNLRIAMSKLEKMAASYLLGMGVFSLILFLTNWFGKVPLQSLTVWGQLGISTFLVWSFNPLANHFLQMKTFFVRKNRLNLPTHFNRYVVAVILSVLAISLWAALNTPVKDWDSLVLYDYRAQVAYKTGYIASAVDRTTFFGYPLMTSIAHLWIYLQGFEFPGIVHWLWYTCLIIIFYYRLRDMIGKTLALYWTPAFMISGQLFNNSMMTYTNLAYTVYLFCGLLYYFAWLKKPSATVLLLSSLLIGLSTWARSSDPFWLLFLIVSALSVLLLKKWHQLAPLILPIIAIRYTWVSIQTYYLKQFQIVTEGVSSYTFSPWLLLDPQRVAQVFSYFFNFVVWPERYYFGFLAIVTSLFFMHRKHFKSLADWAPLVTIVTSGSVAFLGILKFSASYEDWINIGGSATRMMIFVTPLIIYFGAIVLARIWEYWHD